MNRIQSRGGMVFQGVVLMAVLAVICLPRPVEGQQRSSPPSGPMGGLQMGRFELYQGQYENAKNQLSTGLFKIDTATGRVWKYDEQPDKPAQAKGGDQADQTNPLNASWRQVAPY